MEKGFNVNNIKAEHFYLTDTTVSTAKKKRSSKNWDKVTTATEPNKKRATFAMPQSLYDRLKQHSEENNISINELVRHILDTYLKMEGK